MDNIKRIALKETYFAKAVEIGLGSGNSKPSEAATTGVIEAIEFYVKTHEGKTINSSIVNNIEAINALAKNGNMEQDEVDAKINNALKKIITEIMGM